jgi:TolB-like protein
MSGHRNSWPRLVDELKRRRVVRVALVYLAAAFAVLQAADILVPALHLPAWTVTFVAVVLTLGFPIALALAWVLELTPAGVRVTTPAPESPADPPPALLGRHTVLAAGVFVVAGIAFGAGWVLRPDSERAAVANAATVSVAVLPFADLSDDRSQEYFGDGIAEELLNVLRSSDVAVASRTSSFAFKGRSLSVREIAEQLGVDHIIDGSVRKDGNRLRISAQLVDVRSDRQLWSDRFDRDAHDIFRIQDEIATAIASALRVRLAGNAPQSGTRDAEAYDLYLLGLHHWNKRTPDGLWRALEVFTAAAEADPSFARAWAGIAFVHFVLPQYDDSPAERARLLGRAAAEQAVRLDPASAEARTALGSALDMSGDVAGALREYDRAMILDPTFPTAHHWRAIALMGLGRLEESEEALRHALRLDPASLPIQGGLAANLALQRRTEEALAELDALLQRAPAFPSALINSFVFGARVGRAREFEPRLRDYLEGIGADPALAAVIVDGIEDRRQRARAIGVVEAIVGRADLGQRFYLVDLFALLGAREQTLRMLEVQPDWHLMVDRPEFDFIRDDPRFRAVVARRNEVQY